MIDWTTADLIGYLERRTAKASEYSTERSLLAACAVKLSRLETELANVKAEADTLRLSLTDTQQAYRLLDDEHCAALRNLDVLRDRLASHYLSLDEQRSDRLG